MAGHSTAQHSTAGGAPSLSSCARARSPVGSSVQPGGWVARCRQGAVLQCRSGAGSQSPVLVLPCSVAGGSVLGLRGEENAAVPCHCGGQGPGTPRAPEADVGMYLGAGAPVCRGGWGQSCRGDPARPTAPHLCSSSLQRVKEVTVHWPLRYHQDFELSPVAQGKQRGGAKQKSQWKGCFPGRVARSCWSRLPGHTPHQCCPPHQPA